MEPAGRLGRCPDVPTWLLAAGAAVASWYAVRAFSEQHREVAAIEQQVKDGQELAGQQAKLLDLQGQQLEMQRQQLVEQRKLSERQNEVLALQAAELRESLAERKREAVARRNAQASRVSLAMKPIWATPRDFDGGFRLQVTVVNSSEQQQPIYGAKLHWYSNREPYGTDNPELIGTVLSWEKEIRSRTFMPGTKSEACGAVLTFRDAAGVNWIRTADGGLMSGDNDIAPDVARALYMTAGNGAGHGNPGR